MNSPFVNNLLKKVGFSALGVAAASYAASQCLFVVEPGHRAVKFSRNGGVIQETFNEGLHFMVPWLHRVQFFDVRTKPYEISSQTSSKDLQQIHVTIRVLCKPDVHILPKTLSKYGVNYKRKILPSIGNEILKATIAQYDPIEIMTQREHVSSEIREALTKRAEELGIILDDVALTEVSFSPQFMAAIEAKQVAEQEAERAKFIVLKAEQHKKAAIVSAEGQAQAAQLISDAVAEFGEDLIKLRRIETTQIVTKTLSSSPNVVYLPGGTAGSSEKAAPGILMAVPT